MCDGEQHIILFFEFTPDQIVCGSSQFFFFSLLHICSYLFLFVLVSNSNNMSATPEATASTEPTNNTNDDMPEWVQNSSALIELISQDGESFQVPVKVAANARFVRTMLSECSGDEDDELQSIPIPMVKGSVLSKVIEFMQHMNVEVMTTIEKPLRSNKMSDLVQEWYANFINCNDRDLVVEYLKAADFLHVQPLLDLAAAEIGRWFKGKTPDEIRREFNLPEDAGLEDPAEEVPSVPSVAEASSSSSSSSSPSDGETTTIP